MRIARKVCSVLLALVLVLGMLPANMFVGAAELSGTEISVANNVIDITDKQIYKLSGSYQVTATDITVSGAEVVKASEEGTTVHVLLDGTTAPDAAVSVVFGYSGNKCSLTDHTGTVTLENGTGTLNLKVKGYYTSMSSRYSTVDYTIHFTVDAPPTEVPTRLQETDTGSTYNGVALTLDVSRYFENAQTYYLVEGQIKTPLEGRNYTFLSQTGGDHTLVFAASNVVGDCPDYVTVTVSVTEIKSGIWIGKESSNGSMDYVLFTDAEGDPIDGAQVLLEGTTIRVSLPKSYPVSGSVKASFHLTQNGDVPFITTKTGTSGTTSGKAVNNKFTERTTTLSGGAATFTFYYYNITPTSRNNPYETWSIVYTMANDLPVLADGVEATAAATITAGGRYALDLAPIFTDADGDAMTYKVSVNGAAAVAADVNYTFTTDVAGTYILVFTANDTKGDSSETYTVTLTVENVKQTDSMTVSVPEDLEPQFYVSPGFEGGIDRQGDPVEAVKGATVNGMTAYTLHYPINAAMLSVRADKWGGMAFPVQKDGAISLRKLQFAVVDYDNQLAAATNAVTYSGNTAVAGENGWLLVTGAEYVFTSTPVGNGDLETVSKTEILAAGEGIYTVAMILGIKNPLSITVPTGATVNVYRYVKYYDNTDVPAKIIKDNGNGTTTFQFVADTKNNNNSAYIYRVAMAGRITKSGWLAWGQQTLTFTYTDADKSPSFRLEDYSGTGAENSTVAEDSVLLNINSRNHLSLQVGQSKTLKAYRAWEIIPKSYQNYIITPDFHYTVLSGEDVVKLTPKDSNSAGEGDWMTLTAQKEGVAVIEVTYDAIHIGEGSTSDYDGVYGASDPARAGLVVVQVGGGNDTSVKFGIDCLSSIGSAGKNNISYNPNNKKDWDAEFDTLYFTGSYGQLHFAPTAASAITQVAVSNDKGATWTTLTDTNGMYTARIVSGNNILRVTTAGGTAYQIVRGDKLTVKLKEVEGSSDGDGIVEAGETVRVTLVGLHNPIPKMAGNYNPGYNANTDGYSSQHLNYTCNGTGIYGKGAQYNFITSANYVDVVMPDDGSSITLTDGYIGLGVIGLTTFADGGDSHRNIPDGGCSTRDDETTYHTRSMLPQITVSVGNTTSPNGAPIVRQGAVTQGSIYTDQKFAINPDTLFADPDDDTLTFTVSVNGGEAVAAPVTYKFAPAGVGTYVLVFTATDGKLSASHTVTVTVTERPQEEDPAEDFGLEESEIAGYVTVGFEDKGIRVEGETGLKFPEPLGDIVPLTKVPFKQGEKITHVTQRLLEHLGMRMSYIGTLDKDFYLGAIHDFEVDGVPYDSMGEFDAGTGSGWMITQNGVFINMGASEFRVQDGDVIQWKYTCQLGADIGDTYYTAAKEVMALIDAIGTVTKDSGNAIRTARKAYDSLDENQKKKVKNYDVLVAAEAAYAKLVKTAADEAAAKAVDDMIASIGKVTLASEGKIKAARAAYRDLTATQKALVKNLATLEAAEAALEQLKTPAYDLKKIYTTTGDYLERLVKKHGLTVSATGGEWIVVGLARAGRTTPNAAAYYQAVVKFVAANANGKEQLHNAKSTENSRVILALTALGYDVTDVGGHDLLTGLNDMAYLQKQGINGPVWALIALDSGDYEIPGGNVTREKLLDVILKKQLPDGGWTLSGSAADTDMTAMALTALAPYYSANAKVKNAVDKALSCLSKLQDADGGFGSVDGANAESAAQVIVALTALGIDPHTDSRFVKNGRSVLDALCDYYVEGGGFRHIKSKERNGMATEQGYYALVAYFRFAEGKESLFDMDKVQPETEVPAEPEPEQPKPTEPKPTQPQPTDPTPTEPAAPQTKVELTPGGITVVPEELRKAGLETAEDVKQAMERAIIWQDQNVQQSNIAHYNVTLRYSEDGGKTWINADETHFPASGKLTVTVPYPAGTDSSYLFTVAHMFTSTAFGKTPGDVELPKVTNTPEGIQFEVTGLSSVISVGWTAPASGEAPQATEPVDVTTQITVAVVTALVCSCGLAVLLIALRKRGRASQ